jgi:hypothetical protein
MVKQKLNGELEREIILTLTDWSIDREISIFDAETGGYIGIYSSRKISILKEVAEKILDKVEAWLEKNKAPSNS